MTDPARTLHPGGGEVLRRAYSKLQTLSLVAVVVIAALLSTAATGDDILPTVLVGSVLYAVAAVCLVLAISRGRAAVHGDQIEVPALRGSASLARVAGLVGWAGALAVVATGFVQYTRDVDNALLWGIVLGAAGLMLGVCGDAAHRIAKRLLT